MDNARYLFAEWYGINISMEHKTKEDYQVGSFEEAIKEKARQYLHAVVQGSDSERYHFYREIQSIAELAKDALNAKDDEEAQVSE